MAVTNPPLGLQNAGATHTAAQFRTYMAGLQAGIYSAATNLRARGGVHPGLGQELVVTQAGAPNMTVLVEAGVASIPGTEAATQGNYMVCNDAQVTLSISAAHATLPRIDIIVINVRDSFYSTASNDSQLQVITGTPASSPAVPAAPVNSITLAQIAVGAAVTSIVTGNITDTRFYLAAVGGVMNIRNIAAIPAAAEMNEGQHLWAMDTNTEYVWDGSVATQIFPAGMTKIAEQILVGNAAVVTFSSIPSTYRALKVVWTARDDWAGFNADNIWMRINNDSGANYRYANSQVNNNAVIGANAVAAAKGLIGINARGGAAAGIFAGGDITISGWNAPHTNHLVYNFTSGIFDTGVNTGWFLNGSGSYIGAGPYTRLDFIPDDTGRNFVAGSQFVIYGWL